MKIHELKILPEYHEAIWSGDKTCEIRKNDRDFQAGDKIKFVEQNDWHLYEITHVLNFPQGLKEGYVALSIKQLNKKS